MISIRTECSWQVCNYPARSTGKLEELCWPNSLISLPTIFNQPALKRLIVPQWWLFSNSGQVAAKAYQSLMEIADDIETSHFKFVYLNRSDLRVLRIELKA